MSRKRTMPTWKWEITISNCNSCGIVIKRTPKWSPKKQSFGGANQNMSWLSAGRTKPRDDLHTNSKKLNWNRLLWDLSGWKKYKDRSRIRIKNPNFFRLQRNQKRKCNLQTLATSWWQRWAKQQSVGETENASLTQTMVCKERKGDVDSTCKTLERHTTNIPPLR